MGYPPELRKIRPGLYFLIAELVEINAAGRFWYVTGNETLAGCGTFLPRFVFLQGFYNNPSVGGQCRATRICNLTNDMNTFSGTV